MRSSEAKPKHRATLSVLEEAERVGGENPQLKVVSIVGFIICIAQAYADAACD